MEFNDNSIRLNPHSYLSGAVDRRDMLVRSLGDSGGALNVTIPTGGYDCATRSTSTMWSYTIDTSKSYILTITNRYQGTPYATSVYSIINGTLANINNIDISVSGTTATLLGTSLTVTGSGTSSSKYHDITLVQLN